MEWTARAFVAAGALGILWVSSGAVAIAEENAPKQPTSLEAIVDVRSEGNDAAVAVQKRIDEISDSTSRSMACFLAAGQNADEKAKTRGNCYCLERIALDGVLGVLLGLHRLLLGAAHLLAGDAADGGGQILHIGADGFDLLRTQFVSSSCRGRSGAEEQCCAQ